MNPGAKLGPYEIIGAIGAGGMGEVYRARDTRLDRTVAIKILPSGVAVTPEARQRFEREARAISALNHPHICTLYDVGQQDGTDYLVMEFLEGESLAQRLARGAMPLDQVLRYGREVAEALGRAHRAGVIHRDLKPGNIMLTKSGAKLLDFGLAKAAQQPVQMDLSTSRTLMGNSQTILATTPNVAAPLTARGSIVGTFQYMSPEQLEGKEADARSDIFAFGAVLYEMATGRKAFAASSQASLIAAILTSEPPAITKIQSTNPASLDRLIRTCLAKDADQRWQSADDIARELQWIAQGGSQTEAPTVIATPQKKFAFAWRVAAIAAFFAAATATYFAFNRTNPPAKLMTASLELPGNFQLDDYNRAVAISPDGLRLAIAADGSDGRLRLWMRTLSSSDVRPIDGAEGGSYPFWSPDSKFLGFFADRKIKKLEISSGVITTICAAEDGRGASWSDTGEIVFSAGSVGPLNIVNAAGGDPEAITKTAGTETNRLPVMLPGGRKCIFTAGETTKENATIGVLDLKTHEKSTLLNESSDAALARSPSTGKYYLLFRRSTTLLAQEIDPDSARLINSPVTVGENLQQYEPRWTGQFTASDTGLLVFASAKATVPSELRWIDSNGNASAPIGESHVYNQTVLSPDDQSAALEIRGQTNRPDIWVMNLANGKMTRETVGTEGANTPQWSSDGRALFYEQIETGKIARKSLGNVSAEQELTSPTPSFGILSITPDNSAALIAMVGAKGHGAIWAVPLPSGGEPKLLIPKNPDRFAGGGRVSPDGKWIAYFSDDAGGAGQELFVSQYPSLEGEVQCTTNGAGWVKWVNHGAQIDFMQSKDGKIYSVDFSAKNRSVEIGDPHVLFGGRTVLDTSFDISADGKKALMAVPIRNGGNENLTLVSNWTALLHK